MTTMPGHYLGSVANFAADTPWNLEYSLAIDSNGHYQFFSRDPEGSIRLRHSGSSGRAFAQFVMQNGFDATELLQDIRYFDVGFAADFETFLNLRNAR